MPRGSKPKVYDPVLVESVRELYSAGRTQAEVGVELGLTQKIVFNIMRRHDIPPRTAAKRDQRGEKNSTWAGDKATYAAFHKRVEGARGTPLHCERCGTKEPSKRYDWANLTGRYDDINDYERMCRSCHRRFDNARAGGDA